MDHGCGQRTLSLAGTIPEGTPHDMGEPVPLPKSHVGPPLPVVVDGEGGGGGVVISRRRVPYKASMQ